MGVLGIYGNFEFQAVLGYTGNISDCIQKERSVVFRQAFPETFSWNNQAQYAVAYSPADDRAKPGIEALITHLLLNRQKRLTPEVHITKSYGTTTCPSAMYKFSTACGKFCGKQKNILRTANHKNPLSLEKSGMSGISKTLPPQQRDGR